MPCRTDSHASSAQTLLIAAFASNLCRFQLCRRLPKGDRHRVRDAGDTVARRFCARLGQGSTRSLVDVFVAPTAVIPKPIASTAPSTTSRNLAWSP